MIIQIRRRPGAGATIGDGGRRGFKRQYQIRSNVPDEIRSLILGYPTLPKYGRHPEDWTCTVSDIQLDQMSDDPYLWTMDVRWETVHDSNRNETEDQKSPDQRRPKWSAAFQPLANFLPADWNGKLFHNSTGDPFDPAPEMPIYVNAIQIQRFEPEWSNDRDRGYINATNTDVWQTCQPGEALISNIAKEEQWVMGQYWFAYTYTVLENPKIILPAGAGTIGGWNPLLVLDVGTRIKGPGGVPQAWQDAKHVADGRLIYLDGTGHAAVPQPPNPIVTLSFQTKQLAHFGGLSLIPPWDDSYTPYTG